MAKISPEWIQKIKNSNNLLDIVGEHVVLKKSGSNYSGLCPFHAERSPSFSVNEIKQLYHCYGCKEGGDVVSFISKMHGLSFYESLRELAERSSLKLPSEFSEALLGSQDPNIQKEVLERRNQEQTAYRLNRFAAKYFKEQLDFSEDAQAYLKQRKMGPEVLTDFYVGFAHSEWEGLTRFLSEAKAPMALSEQLGLVRKSQKNDQKHPYFDLFRDRVVFPILNLKGKVCGFGGRLLEFKKSEQSNPGNIQPKYLNSPDSFIFKKNKLAFGLYQAQKYVREKDEIIVVEGYFDVLALHQAGFKNAVATCGTALTEEHLKLFAKFASKIVLLFDGDSAGQMAMNRSMELGLNLGIPLYGVFLEGAKDPDEYLNQSPDRREKLETAFKQAKVLLDIKIADAVVEAQKSSEHKVQAIKQVTAWLEMFKDPIGKQLRAQEFAQKLGVDVQLILPTFQRQQGGGPRVNSFKQTSKNQVRRRNIQNQNIDLSEKVVLIGLFNWKKHSEIFTKWLDFTPQKVTICDLFDQVDLKKIAGFMEKTGLGEEKSIDPSLLLNLTEDRQVRSIISEAALSEGEEITQGELEAAIKKRMLQNWARFSHEIELSLAQAETRNDIDLHQKLMKDYLDVQKKIKELNRFYG